MIRHEILDPDLSPDQVREVAKYSARQCGLWERTLSFYLLLIRRRRLFEAWGYSSFEHFVERDLRLDDRKVRDFIALARALDNVPRLDRAFADGEIGWTVLCYLAPVVTPETIEEWLKTAKGKTTREIRALARRVRRGDRPGDPQRMRQKTVAFEIRLPGTVYTKLKRALARMGELSEKKLTMIGRVEALADLANSASPDGSIQGWRTEGTGPRIAIVYHKCPSCSLAWIETDEGRVAIPPEVLEEAMPDGTLTVQAPVDPGEDAVVCFGQRGETPEEDRDPPVPLWKRILVFARDGFRCAVCGRKHDLMCHHLKSRGKGGSSDFENLLAVCAACHAAIHSGLMVIRIREGGRVEALDADGKPLESSGDPARSVGKETGLPFSVAITIPGSQKASDNGTELDERSARSGEEGPSVPRPAIALKDVPSEMSVADFRRIQPLLDWDTGKKG
ncbi:MAG: HNH endonuclease, partial [Planctomycetes bacterium]|nr:HNH endonuclease [Planctomycetota bacterium]